MPPHITEQFDPLIRTKVLTGCLALTITIALLDHFATPNVSLGALYIVPLLICALFLPRWQVIVCAVVATYLREQFGTGAWQSGAPGRIVIGLLAFVSSGLFVTEMVRRRQVEGESLKKIALEARLRREAEEEERVLIQKSPAAILTINPDGRIGLANHAARELLGFREESPEGEPIGKFLPMLDELRKSPRAASLVHSMMEGSGRRRNGDMFLVQMWLSSYQTSAGTKLAAVFADISEQLRDREELGLSQLLLNSRIIVGAVSHEIRNLAAAAGVIHENMSKSGEAESKDFQALGRILEALRKLSSADLPADRESTLNGIDLEPLLRELRIILEPSFREAGVQLRWEIASGLPAVRADHSGLLQIFLNLAQNGLRALSGRPEARVTIAVYQLGGSVVIRFSDSGPGLAHTDGLFQPFQPGATATGLGLYVSRAILRTYGGELQYVRRSGESAFIVELPAMLPVDS